MCRKPKRAACAALRRRHAPPFLGPNAPPPPKHAGPDAPLPGVVPNCWRQDELVRRTRPPLTEDAAADVCVVGAGLTGLCVALEAARAGLSVIVLEARAVGAGMSGRCDGTLSEWDAGSGGFARVEARHGAAAAAAAARARRDAFDWVARIVEEERIIDCAFERAEPATLLSGGGGGEGGNAAAALAQEIDACARSGLAGHHAAPAPAAAAAATRVAGREAAPLPGRAAQLDPVRLAQGLAAALERRGGRIFEGTRAKASWFCARALCLWLPALAGPCPRTLACLPGCLRRSSVLSVAQRSKRRQHHTRSKQQQQQSGPFTIAGRVVTLATNSTDGPVVRCARGGIVLATRSPANRSLALHSRQAPWRTYSAAFEARTRGERGGWGIVPQV